jgi:arylsulfatase A-like enzyme
LPKGKKIDGMDVSGLWKGAVKKSPRKEFLHYTSRGDLEGIRSGNWKLLVKKPRRNNAGKAQLHLFDLAKDIGEKNNLVQTKPEVVEELQARMKALDAEITENARPPWFKK